MTEKAKWVFREHETCGKGDIDDQTGKFVAAWIAREDAERAISCVNALAGIPDPAEFVRTAKDLAEWIRQADKAGAKTIHFEHLNVVEFLAAVGEIKK